MGNKAREAMGLPISPPVGPPVSPVYGPPVPPGEGEPIPIPDFYGTETAADKLAGMPSESDIQRWTNIVEGLYGSGGEREGWPWPTYPQLAEGGIVTTPTLAMIGEQGPEAVIPLRGQRGGLVINFNAPIYGLPDFEKAVAQAVRNASLRGGFYGIKVGA